MAKSTVTYVDHMGNDARAAEAARVSFDGGSFGKDSLSERDVKLIRFLATENHTSPFEHSTLSVAIKCPLFVRSQIMRHRTFSYNEISRRYTSVNLEFYEFGGLRGQATKNLQCSTDELVPHSQELKALIEGHNKLALEVYNRLIKEGVAREQARAVLPQSLMTSFVMTGNLLNWLKFLKLRLDPHAQPECKEVAEMCLSVMRSRFPETLRVFEI
jgi:thymidylate synthase (FAD)